jgi:hypothetical protein
MMNPHHVAHWRAALRALGRSGVSVLQVRHRLPKLLGGLLGGALGGMLGGVPGAAAAVPHPTANEAPQPAPAIARVHDIRARLQALDAAQAAAAPDTEPANGAPPDSAVAQWYNWPNWANWANWNNWNNWNNWLKWGKY